MAIPMSDTQVCRTALATTGLGKYYLCCDLTILPPWWVTYRWYLKQFFVFLNYQPYDPSWVFRLNHPWLISFSFNHKVKNSSWALHFFVSHAAVKWPSWFTLPLMKFEKCQIFHPIQVLISVIIGPLQTSLRHTTCAGVMIEVTAC